MFACISYHCDCIPSLAPTDIRKAIDQHVACKANSVNGILTSNQKSIQAIGHNYRHCVEGQMEAWRHLTNMVDHHVHGSEVDYYKVTQA